MLEWRFDPRSDARFPQATGYGLHRTTDLAGGFIVWAHAGLPVLAG